MEHTAALLYARKLAVRIPSPRVARECYQLLAGWILTGVLAAAARAMIGQGQLRAGQWLMLGAGTDTLIFGLLTLSFILSLRRLLLAAAREARATWARPVTGRAAVAQ